MEFKFVYYTVQDLYIPRMIDDAQKFSKWCEYVGNPSYLLSVEQALSTFNVIGGGPQLNTPI